MRNAALSLSLAVGCVLFLSACNFSMMVTEECFGRADLERAVEHILAEQGGWGTVMAQCPNTLRIRVAAATRCTVQDGDGAVTEVTVMVTEAAGSRGRISVKPA